MSTSKLGIVTNRSTGDQVGEMEPMDRDQAQTIKKAAQRSGISVDVKDPQGNNLAEEISPEDGLNVAKEVAKCLRDALREHGDEMKAMFLANSTNQGATVRVQYMPDEQGRADEDEFVFRWGDGKLRLDNVAHPVELCDLQKQSGSVIFQKDLAKNALLNFLKSHDNVEQPSQEVDPNALPDGPVAEEQLWESEDCQEAFCQAVYNFQNSPADKKEAIKNLFRASRPFKKGNTIQEKLKGAVDWYNIYKENPPKNTQKQVFLEDSYDDALKTLTEIRDKIVDAAEKLEQLSKQDTLTADKCKRWRPTFVEVVEEMSDYINWLTPDPDVEPVDDEIDEFMSLDDPKADGYDNPAPMEPSKEFDDEPVTKEADEFGPEVGDEVEYEGGHYKLYGYCGYQVVLQNVDDERDFKVVEPAAAGIKKPEAVNEETQWVDPDNM